MYSGQCSFLFTSSDNLWSHFTTELELLRKNNDTASQNAKKYIYLFVRK